MSVSSLNWLLLFAVSAFVVGIPKHRAVAAEPVDFNRDIRPIFAAKCFACHGPDESHREAELRLDDRDVAVDHGAIVPGDSEGSEMIRRIFSEDPDEVMPPPHANDSLTDEQKAVFRSWVEEGAVYEPHWAFVPPQQRDLPSVQDSNWPRSPLDYFVLNRIEAEELKPSPEADRYTLVRRLYLDLLGFPPSPAEADAFVESDDPDAYSALVDRLLDSEHYGERWARSWLDLARYADTNGYEKDRERSIWPYRDWVIRALNNDMPYDQFTIEQLAGDMLPGATENQRIATGFHRNTMLNEEGGIDPLEYRFYAMVDRVATTGTVWLGLTTGCAQCHTHKYDPITHTDYYSLMALLNNADEPDQVLKTPDVVQQRDTLTARIQELETTLADHFPPQPGDEPEATRRQLHLEQQLEAWLQAAAAEAATWTTLRPTRMTTNLPRLELLDDGSLFSSGDITKRDVFELTIELTAAELPVTALRLEVMPDERLPAGGPGRGFYEGRKGDFFLSEIDALYDKKDVAFQNASHSYGKISIGSGSADAGNVLDNDGSTGWSTAQREGEPHQLVLNLTQPLTAPGELQLTMLFERHFAASLGRFRLAATSKASPVQATDRPVGLDVVLARPRDTWSDDDRQRLRAHFLRTTPELAASREPIDQLRGQIPSFPTTMVFEERQTDHPRPTYRHHRGEYLSPREEVTPGIPAFLATHSDTLPHDRLEFARWLVSPSNPLAARVAVNRAWQEFLGAGLVRTSGDFGTQADPPTHPHLLDWLANDFVENGWSLKRLHRRIVMSATYRQSSAASPALLRRDPQNELLARGPRHRLHAELVRDTMLRASGLLSTKMYGPSVFPPQPTSVAALAYGDYQWEPSQGEDRYRRSLYTFSKRTAPFAAYTVFDGPTGESCVALRDRSNTPLQALTLLNDDMYLEMARALAKLARNEASEAPHIATLLFRRLLTRPPETTELEAILDYYHAQEQRLRDGALKAADIANDKDASPEQAAWTMTARALMNLDEAITKP